MLTIVKPTRHRFDLDRLREDVERVIALCPFYEETNQISLKHRRQSLGSDATTRFMDGVGRLLEVGDGSATEADFSCLHDMVADTYLGEIFRFVEARYPRTGGRYRIRRLRPKVCMVWHNDDTVKYHIPVYTNRDCFFVTKWGAHRMPEEGRLYRIRTDVFHSVMNTSATDRIHLAIDTTPQAGPLARVRAKALRVLSR